MVAPKSIKTKSNLKEKGHKYNELCTTTDFCKKAVSCQGEQIQAKKKIWLKCKQQFSRSVNQGKNNKSKYFL